MKAASASEMVLLLVALLSMWLTTSEYGLRERACSALSLKLTRTAIPFIPSLCTMRLLSEKATRTVTSWASPIWLRLYGCDWHGMPIQTLPESSRFRFRPPDRRCESLFASAASSQSLLSNETLVHQIDATGCYVECEWCINQWHGHVEVERSGYSKDLVP